MPSYETNRKLNAIAKAFLGEYEFRSVAALAKEADCTTDEVFNLCHQLGYNTSLRRTSDSAPLVGVGDGYNPRAVWAVTDALLDERYTLRTLKAVFDAAPGVDPSEVMDFAAEFDYDTSKTRRRDGAAMIGL